MPVTVYRTVHQLADQTDQLLCSSYRCPIEVSDVLTGAYANLKSGGLWRGRRAGNQITQPTTQIQVFFLLSKLEKARDFIPQLSVGKVEVIRDEHLRR